MTLLIFQIHINIFYNKNNHNQKWKHNLHFIVKPKQNCLNCSLKWRWDNVLNLKQTLLLLFFFILSFCNKIQKCTPNCQCSFISSGTNLNNSFIFNQTTVLFYHVLPTLTANCSFTLRTQERTLLTEHRDIISNVSALPVAESTHWEKCNFISPSCLSQQPAVQTFKWVGKPTTVVKVPILGLVYTIHRPATSSYTVLITIIYLSIKMTQIKQTHDKNLFSTTVHQVLLADCSSSLLSWITLFTQSQLEKPQVIGVSGESIKRFVNTATKKKKTCVKDEIMWCVSIRREFVVMFFFWEWLMCVGVVQGCSGLALDVPAQLLGFVPQVGSAVRLQCWQGALQLLPALHRHAVPLLALCQWRAHTQHK